MTEKPLILDACCGGRAWWHNKHHPAAPFEPLVTHSRNKTHFAFFLKI